MGQVDGVAISPVLVSRDPRLRLISSETVRARVLAVGGKR